ncbi:MAG: FAD-binding and (Fe-S)-binding domain-containing protein [Planctomycetota bacterium]
MSESPPQSQPVETQSHNPDAAALASRLTAKITGEVCFDALSRTIYSTDAGLYEIVPLGVVLPKTVSDVVATVKECQAAGTSIIARGAGTGLTGGAVGPGVQIDFSRYMNRIGSLDLEHRTVEAEPGVVLDELNAHLRPHGLQFAPDVATGSRATIGGMIANNSCGAHSIVHGRTVDHVAELRAVLAGGDVVTFGKIVPSAATPHGGDRLGGMAKRSAAMQSPRAAHLEQELARIRDEYHPEIQQRFPKLLRSNGGYGLDRLGPPGTAADAIKVLCGSEGTLGLIVGATLQLIPVPKHTGLVLLHFENVFDALGAVPAILRHSPAAVELVDRLILDAARGGPVPNRPSSLGKGFDFLQGDPAALLIVECFDEDANILASRIEAIAGDSDLMDSSFATSIVLEAARQAEVWNLRKSGLGLLMSKPGDAQPIGFVEDTAVDPARLREYIERFTAILTREGVEQAGYYAHASVGCIHMRPVLNLKQAADVESMRRIADAVGDLALEFGGAMTGEHGDGIIRSCWLEKMYGPRIIAAFKEIKELFDPQGILNPKKIVDPQPMTEHLRYGASYSSQTVKTHLDFSAHGGPAGLAEMCSGVGQCRQRFVDAMCPSYMATLDETHTTRARANALRIALSNRGLLNGLDDPYLAEVMDLCISCKACKRECPTGVDMARLKAEYLARRNLIDGVSTPARLVADVPRLARWGSLFPRLSNLIAQSKTTRAWIEGRYGFDRRIPPPRFAHRTFRSWYRRHRKRGATGPGAVGCHWSASGGPASASSGHAPRGPLIYFLDCWTNHFVPQVGIAAVTLLERAGFDVHCPQTVCCGRPFISKGILAEARQLAESNVNKLVRHARVGTPIVSTEPSCILTFVDEYPQLVRTKAARRVAEYAMTIESFLCRLLDDDPTAITFASPERPLLYHAHCHQKAIVGSEDAVALLEHVWGPSASLINSGCCGMAGSFGHEKDHYEVARAVGEERLFPAVRNRSDAAIAVSGFSCRQQIAHHAGVEPKHVVEHLADLLKQA